MPHSSRSLRSSGSGGAVWVSLGSSGLLHGMGLIIACMIVWPSLSRDAADSWIETTIVEEEEFDFSTAPTLERPLDLVAAADGGVAPETEHLKLISPQVTPPGTEPPATEQMISQFERMSRLDWAAPVSGLDGLHAGLGTGPASGDGTGGEGFFGLNAAGNSFVFVVDASGSMGRPYPAPARNRFNRVKMELVRTIGAMSPEQKFFIIFFSDNALPMPAQRLMPADPYVQQQYLQWMLQVPAGGNTKPEEALLMALSLRPDVIYFLTDGDFAYRVTETVRRANPLSVPIHTIGFGDNEGERWLLKIAEESGGTYQFITQTNDPLLHPAEE